MRRLVITRIRNAVLSLLLVLAAFGAYRVLAVPLIEPAARRFQGGKNNLAVIDLEAFHARQVAELRPLFPEGSWELENPKIIESNRGKLLFDSYTNLGDGLIEMKPFTMIFYPSDSTMSPEERTRRAVVIETEHGAKLRFDEPLDLRRARFGKLIGAKLPGKVLIRSDSREPGNQDDLLVETRDVTLTEKLVVTDAEVVFRLGENRGRGRQLRIMLDSQSDDEVSSGGPQFAGIEKFSLLHDVQMTLHIAVGDALRAKDATRNNEKEAASPVTIVCQGPFRFDMKQYLIQFDDQVVVERANFGLAPDRLTCQRLLLYLTTEAENGTTMPEPAATEKGKSIASKKLVAKRIEARGPHVVLDARSSGAHAEGEVLQYDFFTQTITLNGKQGALIRRDGSELVAPEILYRTLEGRTFGRFFARGKGHLTANLSEGDVRSVAASWSDELRVYPDPERPGTLVMAMRGDGHIAAGGLGSLDGQEVYAWVAEKEQAGQFVAASQPLDHQQQDARTASGRLEPEKLLAIGDVRIDAAQLNAAVQRLEMWFTNVSVPPATVNAVPSIDHQVARLPASRVVSNVAQPVASFVAMRQRAAQPPLERPKPKMQLTGGKLQAEVILHGSEAALSQLVVEGNVRLTQQRAGPDERPGLHVACDHLFLKQPDPTQAMLTLTGEPAHLESGGMGLDGGQIQLDRAKNRLWIDGPGVMAVDGRAGNVGPLSGGGAMRVVWSGRMDFDGQAAIVSKDVVARTDTQTLTTQWMQVRLDDRVDFANQQSGKQHEVATVDCRGGVLLESRESNEGRLTSVTTLRIERVLLDQRSGDVDCAGPGEVTSVRRGRANPGGMLTGFRRTTPERRSPPQDNGNDKLSYLYVSFLKSLTGNLKGRQMSFNEQVHTIYGPVPTWESTIDIDEDAQLGESVVLMTCDQLNLVEVPGIDQQTRFVELEALGNAEVEGLLYMARAHRITYAQAKDVLTLEGNSRRDAQLYMQENVGQPLQQTEAKLIRYWPSTGEATVVAPRRLDVLQMPK